MIPELRNSVKWVIIESIVAIISSIAYLKTFNIIFYWITLFTIWFCYGMVLLSLKGEEHDSPLLRKETEIPK